MLKDDNPLIHDKIAVPTQKPRTSRPRLLDLLTDNLTNYSATIVNGRAGTGKTTLSAEFARRSTRPVCWYKVDAADAELSVFCQYLISTLHSQRPTLEAERLMEITESVESDRAEVLAEAFVFQLRSEEHTSELQSRLHLVCRLLLEEKNNSVLLCRV